MNARVTDVTTRKGIAVAKKVDAIVVLVTCKSKAEARSIATALVKKRLAACGNILESPVSSIYRWKGKIERAKEYLLILKSTRTAFAALEREVTRLHSYDVPEIIAVPVAHGSQKYLAWIAENVGE
ncbi:MAG TPA: divalent-cation tolerance protein CutA [Candidatus Acidoferrales bacterium]